MLTRPRVHNSFSTLRSDPALQKIFQSETPPVVVFPVSHAVGLSVIRTLESHGVPILAVDFKPQAAGLFSRRVTSVLLPHLYDDMDTFARGVLEIGKCFKQKPVLFLVDDEDLFLSLKQKEEFGKYFHFPLSDWDVVGPIVDKEMFYRKLGEHDLPIPKTWFAHTLEELDAIREDITYPCILKPAYSTSFRQRFSVKAKRFDDYEALRGYAAKVLEAEIRFIIQEFIAGEMGRLLTYVAYSKSGGEVLASFCGRKVHQFPPDFGTCRLGESIEHPGLEDLGRRLLKVLGYRGISLTEFKVDGEGRLKALELNPRPGDWPERLAQICGANVVLAAYHDSLGHEVAPSRAHRIGLKWANIAEDFYYCVRGYKLLGFPWAHRGLGGWIKDLRGLRTGAFFSIADPIPALVRTWGMLKELWRRERDLRSRK